VIRRSMRVMKGRCHVVEGVRCLRSRQRGSGRMAVPGSGPGGLADDSGDLVDCGGRNPRSCSTSPAASPASSVLPGRITEEPAGLTCRVQQCESRALTQPGKPRSLPGLSRLRTGRRGLGHPFPLR
jgi:hypothetical protein